MRWNLYLSATLALGCLALPVAAQPTTPPANDAGVSPSPQAPPSTPAAPVYPAPAAPPPAGAPTPVPVAPVAPSEPAAPAAGEAPNATPPVAEPQPPAEGAAQPVAPAPAAPASATPPAPPATYVASATPAAEGGAFEERGKSLYIRLAAGFAIPVGPDIADSYAMRRGRELQFTGFSFATDWMGGAMLLPWLAVGLGATSDNIVGGSVHYANNTKQSLASSLYYFVVGPFADVYFKPPAGWHIQAMFGVAHLSLAENLSRGATGFGAVLGGGYEVAVAPRWNIGALARLAISPLSASASGNEKPSPTVFEPSLLFSATFRPAH